MISYGVLTFNGREGGSLDKAKCSGCWLTTFPLCLPWWEAEKARMLVSCGLTASFKCWGLPGSSSGRKHQRPLSALSGRQSSSSAPEVCSGGFSFMSVETGRGLLPSSSLHGNHRMVPVPITPSIHCSSFRRPEFYAFRWKGDTGFHFLSPCLYIHTLWGERDTRGMSSWQHFLEIQAKGRKTMTGALPRKLCKGHTSHWFNIIFPVANHQTCPSVNLS